VAEIHHRRGALAEALAQYRAALALARNDPDLQQTVAELARQVEPLPPPASADGLSFEQMQSEFLANLPAPPAVKPLAAAPAPPPEAAAPPPPDPVPFAAAPAPVVVAVEPPAAPVFVSAPAPDVRPEPLVEDTAERDRALQVVAVLNQWLDAIHVTRAQPLA
jgi:hypothetical protein